MTFENARGGVVIPFKDVKNTSTLQNDLPLGTLTILKFGVSRNGDGVLLVAHSSKPKELIIFFSNEIHQITQNWPRAFSPVKNGFVINALELHGFCVIDGKIVKA
ncbi:MAG: hypothetical protein JXR34_12085 [Bacteroidales bacterium]|nr:hypothetical protein [Bacteroidales bacterium]